MWNFKKLQKTFAVLFLLCMIPLGMNAQKVNGTVTDEAGEPVIGAAVQVQGTRTGDVTDLNGKFSVDASSDATLIISYLGFVTETVRVNGRNNIQVTLKEDVESLNDVVVIGYGTQKKKLVTGATIQVKGEDIAMQNTTNALGALASSTPGVQITQSSSQPGKGFKVFIRGIGHGNEHVDFISQGNMILAQLHGYFHGSFAGFLIRGGLFRGGFIWLDGAGGDFDRPGAFDEIHEQGDVSFQFLVDIFRGAVPGYARLLLPA